MGTASVIWWLVALTRPWLERLMERFNKNKTNAAQNNIDATEEAYRKTVFKLTRGMHLAASLFPLEDIIEAPNLLAPPAVFKPNETHYHSSVVEKAIPYLRNYPELGAFYSTPTLTLPQAISGGKNIAIIGQPGTGKSTALAYLASQITQSPQVDKSLAKYIPFLLHVADLKLPILNDKKPVDFLGPIIENTSQRMGIFYNSRISSFIENAFASGRALLLLDGVDEISQAAIREVGEYLRILLQQYPKITTVITASPEFLDGILFLNFVPLSIMPWNAEQKEHFLKSWANQWEKYISDQSWLQGAHQIVDYTLLNRWLSAENHNLTPLEFTLKVWGAYAEDNKSTQNTDLIEAHIRRLTPSGISEENLAALAANTVLHEMAVFDTKKLREWAGTNEINRNADLSGKIAFLIDSGLLLSRNGDSVSFCNPIFQGFLAAKQINATEAATSLLNQSVWVGQTTCLRFMASQIDLAEVANALLEKEDPILMRPQLLAGRLLRDSSASNNQWRDLIMTRLVQILQNDDYPIGLRGEALVSLILSGDPNTGSLFRQLMQAPSNELRQLAALGSGMLRDSRAVDLLIKLVENSLETTRQAAVLALIEIGSRKALEVVATYLLGGDEQLRIYSAEAFANHKKEGKSVLLDGINSEDILVRRASVYGLTRIHESWSKELLEKVLAHDEQWAVRNVAVESLKILQNADPRIPKKTIPPHENPWLIEFAGKYGMGIAPSQPTTDIILLAIKDVNREYFLPALEYIRETPSEGVMATLYPFLFGTDDEFKEAVFQTLSIYAFGGVTLPQPKHFGLG